MSQFIWTHFWTIEPLQVVENELKLKILQISIILKEAYICNFWKNLV